MLSGALPACGGVRAATVSRQTAPDPRSESSHPARPPHTPPGPDGGGPPCAKSHDPAGAFPELRWSSHSDHSVLSSAEPRIHTPTCTQTRRVVVHQGGEARIAAPRSDLCFRVAMGVGRGCDRLLGRRLGRGGGPSALVPRVSGGHTPLLPPGAPIAEGSGRVSRGQRRYARISQSERGRRCPGRGGRAGPLGFSLSDGENSSSSGPTWAEASLKRCR
jgi:hypothetical protein